ncbi:hypothetical protein K8Z61_18545 [Nocardioides sp. TRM66260-LWL]|uniref:hypothetical protein n=1 Tax=Nocardioides sp. TRM66260-LWL TaxID=2874478 RepID=UPI001CC55DE9|nr:hypothetical protein [Nocardioides sp. TRM66260-LWL]MBZ5736495.1 hypothetical protein [Nocardioides sp. TRM66260-LWL]
MTSLDAAPGSMLEDLRARRAKAVERLHLDRPVPGLKPLTVRFRPLTVIELARIGKTYEGSTDPDANTNHDATVLATSCVAVWDRIDDRPPPADAPTFSSGLAERLGLEPDASATVVVRSLYLTDGDVISAAARVQRWSGFSIDEVDRDAQGN